MEEKIQSLINNNHDLLQLTGVALIILAALIAIYLCYASSIKAPETSYVDQSSGETVIMVKTGAQNDEQVSIIGLDSDIIKDLDVEAFANARLKLANFFAISYPNIKTLSYIKNSAQQIKQGYNFMLISDTKEHFNIEISGNNANDYHLKITKGKQVILDFSPAKAEQPQRIAESLPKKFLPHSFELDGKPGVVAYDKLRKTYSIKINSCGDQNIKDRALAATEDWLKSINYNPKDFNFIIPNYCDGSANHH